MPTETETDIADLDLNEDQLTNILKTKYELSHGKKVRRLHKKRYQKLLCKIGFKSLMPKFNKVPKLWKSFTLDFVTFKFIQDDFEMPPYIIKEMSDYFHMLYTYVPLLKTDEAMISPFEHDKLFSSFAPIIDECFSEKSKVYKVCTPFCEKLKSRESSDKYFEAIRRIILHTTRSFSSLHSWLYVASFDSGYNKEKDGLGIQFTIRINRKKADIYNHRGRKSRKYYKLEMSSMYLHEFIDGRAIFEGVDYPIYIQAHALKRIEERTHVALKYVTDMLLNQVDFRDVRTYGGNLLIPVYANRSLRSKIGYLLGNIKDEKLLLNTFLFISQDGTPEGDKLNELLKINKIEKQYLEMDRVEHFINSTLKDDKELYPLFEACQLTHLFRLTFPNGKKRESTHNADFIKDMLQLENSSLLHELEKKPTISGDMFFN